MTRALLIVLSCCLACKQPPPPQAPPPDPKPAAAPAARPQAPPRQAAPPPRPVPPGDGLDALLVRALNECRVVGTPGARPMGCDPLLAAIALRAAAGAPDDLSRWADAAASMQQRDVAVLSWLAAEHLPSIVRSLAASPDPQARPHVERLIAALVTASATLDGLHLFAEPAAQLAGLHAIDLGPLLAASRDPRARANLLRASMRYARAAALPLVAPYMASDDDALATAALEAPWQLGAWSDAEARALCTAYAALAPAHSAPRAALITRGKLACAPAQQRAALKDAVASGDPAQLAALSDRCTPHPFSPWPRPAAPSLCKDALKQLASLASAGGPAAPAAADAIGKGWPTPAGEAALKGLTRSEDAAVREAAERGLKLIKMIRDLQQETKDNRP